MWVRLRSNDFWVTAALAAALFSVVVWCLAILLGFDEAPANAPATYKTYFQEINWWPFPFFFLGVAPALWLTWTPMLQAWGQLAGTGVLKGPEGGKPDEAVVQQVLTSLRRTRGAAVLAAFAIALAVNLADWTPNAGVFLGTVGPDRQLSFACLHPGSAVKWIFVAQAGTGKTLCTPPAEGPLRSGDNQAIAPPPGQILFNASLMAQQFLIVFFAALAVVQLLLHTLLFAIFERLAVARAHGLYLMLNCSSPLNEFGLEHWNYALNNFYWAVSPALLGVFLSRASTPPENYLPGQVILGFAVPACLIVPMVATIIARQARLPETWTTIEPTGPVKADDYRRQQLWPLDRNWSSKIGILVAFALAALSIGFEITKLMPI